MSAARKAQLALLKELFEQGMLSEQAFRAKLSELGVDAPAPFFDQQQQHVEQQWNVAGNVTFQAAETGADPAALKRAYLHRLIQQTHRLPLSGVDLKSAMTEGSRELQLGAVYTALLTQRPEADDKLGAQDFSARLEHEPRHLSAVELLNREAHLVLLGDPGSGKSTFVNFVGLCLAGEALADPDLNLAALTAPLPADDERSRRDQESPPQAWGGTRPAFAGAHCFARPGRSGPAGVG